MSLLPIIRQQYEQMVHCSKMKCDFRRKIPAAGVQTIRAASSYQSSCSDFFKKHIFTFSSTLFQCCVPVNPLAEGTIQQYLQISVAATPCQIPHMAISEKMTLLLYFPGSFFRNYPNNRVVTLTKLRFWLFLSNFGFSTLQIKQRLGTLQISLG